jgi:hypothetical protein
VLRRLAAACVLAACLAPILLAGCAKKKLLAIANLPPETTLFVQGSVDTVNHLVHLYWFGSDPDGDVVGFELRFKNPAQPADTQWSFTTRTDSTLAVFTPTGYAMPVFEIRAIDGSPTPRPADAASGSPSGARDPTPARQDFQFSNQPPTVRFTDRLRTTDTTYASVTLAWSANDPDGDPSAMRFLVGLDTLPTALRLVSGARVTIDTDDFKEGGAYPATQPRMAFIRAIDDGGRASGWDSVRWVVREPATPGLHPRLLLIDDVPASNPANVTLDTLYYNTASRNLPDGSYSILRLELTQPFRSVQDVAQTCGQFDAVIWYRGTQAGFSSLMRNYQDGLAAYLDGGGQLMIESLNLVEGENATGALRGDWVTRYLGSTDLIRSPIPTRADSTVSWSINTSFTDTIDGNPVDHRVDLHSTVFADSLRNNIIVTGLRGFAVRDTGFVALWARDSSLSPRVARGIPVAVTVPVPENPAGPGRAIVFTLPIRGANGFFNVPEFLAKVFQQLGLTGP